MILNLIRSAQSVISATVCFLVLLSQVIAQNSDSAESSPAPNLAASQEAIEMRYRRFEGTLQQLSEYLRKSDPGRAELLIRAIGKSKEGRIPEQLGHLTDLLKKDQLGDAVERQELLVTELQSLLELLMSEARKDDLEAEKKRVQELIKDVNKLISKETDARAETERGGNNLDLQSQQKQVAETTQKLVQKIESQDAARKQGKQNDKDSPRSEKKSSDKNDPDSSDSENPSSDKKSDEKMDGKEDPKSESGRPPEEKSDKKPSDEKNGKDSNKNPSKDEPKPGDAESKPSDSNESDDSQKKDPQSSKSQKGKPQDGKPQKGKPQKGQSQEGQQQEEQPPQDASKQDNQQDQREESPENEAGPKKQQDKTAGRDELERAKLEMDRAIEELKKNNRKNASDKQDKAIAELMKAKEKLEEILRQLREEEKELVLAQMEARFRDMLLRQEAVNNATLAINAVDVDNRTDRHRNRAVELARNEDEIALLASKALTLLKEEGSSIAFPEALEQIREDMQTIARRLERVDVGEITQNIQQDSVESLKEILEALQKEMEKLKDKKQQQQQQQKQEQQQKSLVNQLAEMKMLRSLQYRVNRRTKQLGRLVEGEQSVDPDILNQLKQLSDRQAKVQKTTYDLSTGKNQ